MFTQVKFKRAIGYFEAGGLLCELEDGRFALIGIDSVNVTDKNIRKGEVSYTDYTFTRGKEVNKEIPEGAIEKAIKILENPNSNLLELDDKYFKEFIDEYRKKHK